MIIILYNKTHKIYTWMWGIQEYTRVYAQDIATSGHLLWKMKVILTTVSWPTTDLSTVIISLAYSRSIQPYSCIFVIASAER